ncbi:LytR/AlgR family response regulator transcription factor [Pseudofulvimonas gallinarii]|nr:LytTR family DNA-binding domain-containing protein [Pseudofulvimonas gallinarii]THD14209.1 DNA-binding response regulator [Pseudofulvimonas gallinarii]
MSDQTLRTLIVDDEPLARRGLRLRLAGETDIDIIGECTNGEEAVRVIAAEKPDLVFLDVQMPGLDGFGVLRRLPLSNLPMVVFVTAFDHYAIGAFEASAVDYLLKPVEEARLSQALFRVREQAQARAASEQRDQLLELLGSVTGRPELSLEDALAAGAALPDSRRPVRLAIRDGGKTVLVEETDIDWIDAAGDYMCIHAKGDTHILRGTLRELEAKLDADRFARIHRSTIVNIARVRELRPHINGEYFLTLDGGHEVKLSRSYRDQLRRFRD